MRGDFFISRQDKKILMKKKFVHPKSISGKGGLKVWAGGAGRGMVLSRRQAKGEFHKI